jgi:hypothetical protein
MSMFVGRQQVSGEMLKMILIDHKTPMGYN